MHSVCHGVVKDLFKLWFDLPGKQSLLLKKEEIDRRLLQIKPPSFVQTAPRSINEYKNWRAKEFLNFILFYSLYVFKDIMKIEYYENLKCLVISLEVLFSKLIKKSDLILEEKLLFKFLTELGILNSENIFTSSFHELVHVVDLTRRFGPLNITSCFQYEELNRKVLQFVKGKNKIAEEFIK